MIYFKTVVQSLSVPFSAEQDRGEHVCNSVQYLWYISSEAIWQNMYFR